MSQYSAVHRTSDSSLSPDRFIVSVHFYLQFWFVNKNETVYTIFISFELLLSCTLVTTTTVSAPFRRGGAGGATVMQALSTFVHDTFDAALQRVTEKRSAHGG